MENHEIIDLAIIGGGPAGLSAALYAQRALLDSVLIEKEAIGGQTILTSEIDNYPGVPHTDGFTLSNLMRTQAEELGAKIVADRVTSLSHDSGTGIFTITADAAEYHAKTVIVAGGATPRHAGFVGEDTYSGHGISYCATCDGMFYRGK
ncbi:MAG: FAD-dependent oxidoreductase, partial [Atopobiaceae bacterium]|nr:FAD-dependent oxidoreductase [Atopobiaceae bacterium]